MAMLNDYVSAAPRNQTRESAFLVQTVRRPRANRLDSARLQLCAHVCRQSSGAAWEGGRRRKGGREGDGGRREGGRKGAVSYTHLRAHETEADL
eukprot:3461156-Rhodomonas_salina.1